MLKHRISGTAIKYPVLLTNLAVLLVNNKEAKLLFRV